MRVPNHPVRKTGSWWGSGREFAGSRLISIWYLLQVKMNVGKYIYKDVHRLNEVFSLFDLKIPSVY